jgi:hypothetical protein
MGLDSAPPDLVQTGSRLALLLCNGTFPKIPRYELPGVARDAIEVEKILSDDETCRFTVLTLVDRGLLEVRREIERICRQATENDTILIYYSGGSRMGGDDSLYLLVNDSEEEFLGATAFGAEFIVSQLRGSKCRKIVLLVDTCHSGAFFNNNRGIPSGLFAITSCSADEACPDTHEGGPFSVALCAGLRGSAADADGDGMVSIDELHEFIKDRLRAQHYSVTPQKWVWNVPEPIYISTVPRHVFISYSRMDQSEALKLKAAIEGEGLPVWIDLEGMQSGDWKERVTQSLKHSRVVIMLLTPNSLDPRSPVKKELNFAALENVPIIPVHLGPLETESLPEWFKFDYSDVHRHQLDAANYDAGVKKLVSAIRRLRGPVPALASRERPGE